MASCNNVEWAYFRPTGDTNRAANPSIEFDTDYYVADAGTTLARNTTYHWSGAACMSITNAAGTPGWITSSVLFVTIGTTYYFKARLLGVVGEPYRFAVYDVFPGVAIATLDHVATGAWDAVIVPFSSAVGGYAVVRCAALNGAGAGSPFYIDAIEIVSVPNATYLDGDQVDCIWTGIPHASASIRRATMRGGGVPIDFQTDYYFTLGSESGTGLRPVSYQELDRTYYPGTQTTGIKIERRVWQLGGIIKRNTWELFRKTRNEFISEISPLSFPKINNAPQDVRWQYTGSERTLVIPGKYEGGLDVAITAQDLSFERVALRVLSNDHPLWYELPQTGAELDTMDEPTYTNAITFARQEGVWDVVNTTAGATLAVNAVAVNGDGMIYFGGGFSSINGDASLQYLARYNPLVASWEVVGAGAMSDVVRALLPLPDGRIMIGGDFLNVGDANGDYVTIFDPGTGGFTSLNTNPLNDIVRGLALDPTTGDVIIVGDFTQDAVPTTLNRVARWTGGTANFTANGTTLDADVYGVGVRRNGQIVVAGVHTEKISACDTGTTTWYEVGNVSGANNDARMVFVDPDDDTVFVGGSFTQFDGETANAIVQFGAISTAYVQWSALGSGMTGGTVTGMAKHPDGSYRVVGTWTAVGDLGAAAQILRWTGSQWSYELVDLFWGTITGVLCVAIGADGNEWYGTTDIPAGAQTAGHTAITCPDGLAPTPPVITIRKIGSSGTAYLYGIEHYQTGKRITFDVPILLDDETITIDCDARTIKSTVGRLLAPIAGTVPDLELLTGTNDIYFYVTASATATVIARAYWSNRFWSVDAAEDAD